MQISKNTRKKCYTLKENVSDHAPRSRNNGNLTCAAGHNIARKKIIIQEKCLHLVARNRSRKLALRRQQRPRLLSSQLKMQSSSDRNFQLLFSRSFTASKKLSAEATPKEDPYQAALFGIYHFRLLFITPTNSNNLILSPQTGR